MFARIDHIGVAVESIDDALRLYEAAYAMKLVHREVVEEQGVEAVLLDVGENHVELLQPLGRGHAGRQVPREARPRASTTSPTRCGTSTPSSSVCARRASS